MSFHLDTTPVIRKKNPPSHWLGLFVFILAGLLLSMPTFSQSGFGTLTGTVTDASGAVVVDAPVTLTNVDTGEKRVNNTGGSGNYNFVNLNPGNYSLEITKEGFEGYKQSGVAVRVQTTTRADIKLQVGMATTSVEVTTAAALLQTDSANLSSVIQGRQVEQAPLNGRNVMSLVTLVPGVVAQGGSQGNPAGNNNQGWGNFQFGGGIADQGAEYFDGVLLNTSYTNQPALVPSQDFIKEFIVSTNSTGAEYGNTSGGVVNMASKSGTNDLHFSAYEFIRNKVLNANLFFSNRLGTPRTAFTQNQYGATVGGPILKQKAFFFFSWEAFALRQGNTLLTSVPSDAERTGDFSASNFPAIYDPCGAAGFNASTLLCSGTPSARTKFTGNVIPANRISTVAQHLLALFPHANITTAAPVNNFTRSYATGLNYDQYNIRGDYAISARQNIFVRYGDWRSHRLPTDSLGTKMGNINYFASKQAVVGDTITLSPTTILDTRLAFTRFFTTTTPQMAGLDQTTVGLPASYNSEINRGWPTPCISGQFTTFCSNNLDLTIVGANNNFEIVSGITKIRGSHTMKAGVTLRTMEFNFGQTNNGSGFYGFDGGYTSGTGSAGDAFASYLLGYPVNNAAGGAATGIVQGKNTAATQWYQGYYVTDTWQATPRLTATIGVRYEIAQYWKERHDSLAVFLSGNSSPLGSFTDPVTSNVIKMQGQATLVNSPAYGSRIGMDTRFNMWAPRIGLAYRANPSLVIRSGYGIFYLPTAASFTAAPSSSSVNSANTPIPIPNGTIPLTELNNPFPNGFAQPGGHSQAFLDTRLGSTLSAYFPHQSRPYNQQWNLAIAQQIKSNSSIEVAYAGASGVRLPNGASANQLAPSLLNQAATQYAAGGLAAVTINQTVANPLASVITGEPATISYGQLLLPYPQYTNVTESQVNAYHTNYQALQSKFEGRYGKAGTLLVAYTWSKFISNTDTLATYLESNGSTNNGGNYMYLANPRGERSVSAGNVPHVVVVSYNLDLPFGKGRRFANNLAPVVDAVIGGWGVNGITTFESGFPLTLSLTPIPTQLSKLNISDRPSVVPGCNAAVSGKPYDRVNGWVNKSCFYSPATGATTAANGVVIAGNPYVLGNEPRVDPRLKQQGVKNYDFALFKRTSVFEKVNIEFRAEFFNVFNTTRFSAPNSQVGSSTFGVVTAQNNNPRLVQFGLRISR